MVTYPWLTKMYNANVYSGYNVAYIAMIEMIGRQTYKNMIHCKRSQLEVFIYIRYGTWKPPNYWIFSALEKAENTYN